MATMDEGQAARLNNSFPTLKDYQVGNRIQKLDDDGNLVGDSTGTHTGPVVGDVTGDLTGDSAGTHTGPVVGDVTGDLTGDSAGTHTGPVVGDVTGNTAGVHTGAVVFPTEDPHVAGQWWDNAGVLTKSAG